MIRIGSWVDLSYVITGLAVGASVGAFFRFAVIPRLARVAQRTATLVDDVLVAQLGQPLLLWGALIGSQAGLRLVGWEGVAATWIGNAITVVMIVSVAWTAGSVVARLVHVPPSVSGALPSARILSTASRAAVTLIGVLVALQTVGVSVAPILTALGVGGLAVGLALQDTLANLFAGFHILASRQLRPGDFVQLSSGEQGVVEDITWRNTTIRQLSNNIVIVPNAQLARAITLNYSLPDNEQAVLVPVGVSYDDNLDLVERVTVEVAAEVQRTVVGAVRSFTPFVRYHSFGDSSIDLTVILRAEAFVDGYLMKHEFVKRLASRYRQEGITIPYPQRSVHVDTRPGLPVG